MSFMNFIMRVNSIFVSLLFRLFTLSLSLLFHFQNCSNVSAKSLQQQLDILDGERMKWHTKAREYERTLTCSMEYCTTRDEINEVGGMNDTLPKASLNLNCVSKCLCMCTCTHMRDSDLFFTLDLQSTEQWPQGSESLSKLQAPKFVEVSALSMHRKTQRVVLLFIICFFSPPHSNPYSSHVLE